MVNVGSEWDPRILDFDDLDGGYHLYQLQFDPVVGQASLSVDGTLRATNIDPFLGYGGEWNTSITFGSTAGAGQGHANYALVKYEILDAPCDFLPDGFVDGADFLAWQRGQSPSPLSAGDLAEWGAHFGAAVDKVANVAVPEPSTMLLLTVGLTMMLRRRRPAWAPIAQQENESKLRRLERLINDRSDTGPPSALAQQLAADLTIFRTYEYLIEHSASWCRPSLPNQWEDVGSDESRDASTTTTLVLAFCSAPCC